MFIAGDLERDGALIEHMLAVLEGARVARCPSQHPGNEPVRLHLMVLDGPEPQAPPPPQGPG